MSDTHCSKALSGSEPIGTNTRPVANRRYEDDEAVTVSFRTAGPESEDLDEALADILDQPPRLRHHLSNEEVRQRLAAAAESLNAVAETMGQAGFSVADPDPVSGSIEVSGSFRELCSVLHVEPQIHQGPNGPVRSHRGPIHLPVELEGVVEAVLGLDDHPVAWPHHGVDASIQHHPINALEIAGLYDFPPGDGNGQKVGIIELGGGFHQEDLEHYCSLTGVPTPKVAVREIAGAKNNPADTQSMAAALEAYGLTTRHREPAHSPAPESGGSSIADVLWTIETSLDLELVATFAPQADITLYFSANNSHGKVKAMQAALDDGCSIISISFGARERGVNTSYVQQMELQLKRAALQGVTVCCASGDGGYLEYPASSPYSTACGGTSLHDAEGNPAPESVWNEAVPVPHARLMLSSGGISTLFDLPKWQQNIDVLQKTGLSARGVPDVAAKADLAAGYRIVAGGQVFATGGTSAAAPLWAGLLARVNQRLAEEDESRVGHLPSLVYRKDWTGALRDVTLGRSGMYRACSGWDPCTGLGSPDGKKLLELALAIE